MRETTCENAERERIAESGFDGVHDLEEISRKTTLQLESVAILYVEQKCKECGTVIKGNDATGSIPESLDDVLKIAIELYEKTYEDPREVGYNGLLALSQGFDENRHLAADALLRANKLALDDVENDVRIRSDEEIVARLLDR